MCAPRGHWSRHHWSLRLTHDHSWAAASEHYFHLHHAFSNHALSNNAPIPYPAAVGCAGTGPSISSSYSSWLCFSAHSVDSWSACSWSQTHKAMSVTISQDSTRYHVCTSFFISDTMCRSKARPAGVCMGASTAPHATMTCLSHTEHSSRSTPSRTVGAALGPSTLEYLQHLQHSPPRCSSTAETVLHVDYESVCTGLAVSLTDLFLRPIFWFRPLDYWYVLSPIICRYFLIRSRNYNRSSYFSHFPLFFMKVR